MVQHADIDHTGVTGVSGNVAADAIWDAKGDLAAGTGANTGSKLTAGANDTILMADSGQSTGLKWVASQTPSTQAFGDAAAEGTADTYARGDHKHAMPANPAPSELAFVEFTSDVSTTASSEATATSVVSAGAVSFNGSTRVRIEFYSPRLVAPNGQSIILTLYDGSSSIGLIGQFHGSATNVAGPVQASRYLTPSNASHTYSVRVYTGGSSGSVGGGAGGSGNFIPGFIRIVTA